MRFPSSRNICSPTTLVSVCWNGWLVLKLSVVSVESPRLSIIQHPLCVIQHYGTRQEQDVSSTIHKESECVC